MNFMYNLKRKLRKKHCEGCRHEYLTGKLRFCQRPNRSSSTYTLNTAKLFCFSKKKKED